jgi:hypothetical protein
MAPATRRPKRREPLRTITAPHTSEVGHEAGRPVAPVEHAHPGLDRIPRLEDLLHADAADEPDRLPARGDLAPRGHALGRSHARRRRRRRHRLPPPHQARARGGHRGHFRLRRGLEHHHAPAHYRPHGGEEGRYPHPPHRLPPLLRGQAPAGPHPLLLRASRRHPGPRPVDARHADRLVGHRRGLWRPPQ